MLGQVLDPARPAVRVEALRSAVNVRHPWCTPGTRRAERRVAVAPVLAAGAGAEIQHGDPAARVGRGDRARQAGGPGADDGEIDAQTRAQACARALGR